MKKAIRVWVLIACVFGFFRMLPRPAVAQANQWSGFCCGPGADNQMAYIDVGCSGCVNIGNGQADSNGSCTGGGPPSAFEPSYDPNNPCGDYGTGGNLDIRSAPPNGSCDTAPSPDPCTRGNPNDQCATSYPNKTWDLNFDTCNGGGSGGGGGEGGGGGSECGTPQGNCESGCDDLCCYNECQTACSWGSGCGNYNWCDECSCCSYMYEAILIDVTGDGYALTSPTTGVAFDMAGGGTTTQVAWTSASSNVAFLALDRNGNGRIDNGSELFGPYTAQPGPVGERNGFNALAVYDQPAYGGNGDGWIDARDAVYSKLLLWIDRNHDGISERDELFTLSQLGIRRIRVSREDSQRQDAFGNIFHYRAQMINDRSPQGESRWAYEVALRVPK